MKPLHNHNCDSCIYYGTEEGIDIYLCNPYREGKSSLRYITVVMRFSDDGSDYCSTNIQHIFDGNCVGEKHYRIAHKLLKHLPIYKIIKELVEKEFVIEMMKNYIYHHPFHPENPSESLQECLDVLYFSNEKD